MKRISAINNSDDGRRNVKYVLHVKWWTDVLNKSVDDPIFGIVPICGQVDMQTHLRLEIAAEYVYLCKYSFTEKTTTMSLPNLKGVTIFLEK